jgi:hypothetical protein
VIFYTSPDPEAVSAISRFSKDDDSPLSGKLLVTSQLAINYVIDINNTILLRLMLISLGILGL